MSLEEKNAANVLTTAASLMFHHIVWIIIIPSAHENTVHVHADPGKDPL